LRVAIILSRIDQLGPVNVIRNLVKCLSEYDEFKIRVFYFDKNVNLNVRMDVPIERLNRRKFLFSDYDIVHTNGIRPDLFAFLNRKKIKYHISTVHNFVFDDLLFTYNRLISWFFGNVWLILWRRADKLVCVSKAMKNYYKRWFPVSKLEVIYNGINDSDSLSLSNPDIVDAIDSFHSRGLKVLGSAGILTKRKGIDQIMYLVAAEKELALVIIGDGKELPKLLSLSKKLKISNRCLFCGFISNAVCLFRHFDFFIMPSRSEGFGLVLIEAVQQKVAVICSDIPVFNELFNNEEVTFFKLNDLKSLTVAFKLAKEEGNKKTDLAYDRYLSNYTAQSMARGYYELYKSVQRTPIN
jgi:glycosyltransferase involved in cell wall biosynthesis